MIEIISDHKPTNADRIRSMSDEELAKFIEAIRCSSLSINEKNGLYICKSINGNYCHGIKDRKTNKDILEWLQRQVG